MAGFQGHFVKKVLNCGRNLNMGGDPFWIMEFKGHDGLRYVATYFGPGQCAIICSVAPMRSDIHAGKRDERGYEFEISLYISLVVEAQEKLRAQAAQAQADIANEDPVVIEDEEEEEETA